MHVHLRKLFLILIWNEVISPISYCNKEETNFNNLPYNNINTF